MNIILAKAAHFGFAIHVRSICGQCSNLIAIAVPTSIMQTFLGIR